MSNTLTFILALWGSILSTVLFVFKVYEVRADRAAIWIRARFGSMSGGPECVERGLSIRIVNRGRRTAYIREVRVRMRRPTDIKMEGEGTSLGNTRFWLHQPWGTDPIELDEAQQKHFSKWVGLKDQRCYVGAVAEVVTTTGRCFRSKVVDLFENDDLGQDTVV